MSLCDSGQWICCDGEGCSARAPAPVALHNTAPLREREGPALRGWLFVVNNGICLHYCPQCMPQHLARLAVNSDK